MATKAIKFSNNTTTYLPVTDASLVQMKVGNETKSIKEVILENEEVTAAAYNELNDRLTNVETSYVKSIATSGTGTFINGVTIGNDSTGGKKLTFSYGTATSDVFITNVTAYTVDNISSGDNQILFENITFDKSRDNILTAISAEKAVVARLTIWNNNTSIHTIDLHLNEDLPAPAPDIHFIGTGFINSSNYFINIVNTSDIVNEGGAQLIPIITNENISYWTNKQDTLVSGTSIKTINNTSLLGSGNIEVQAPLTQHDTVTVTVNQLKYDAGQTITLDDSFVNSALGSYTTTSLTGSSSNDYWKYTTSNN